MTDLAGWYVKTFTIEERKHIASMYQPMVVGGGSNTARSNPIDLPPAQKLWALVGWFKGENDRSIALRLADGALEFADETLDQHFALQHSIELHYRMRAQPQHMSAAEAFCRQQIALAPEALRAFRNQFAQEGRDPDFMVSHVGYRQLAIILEKRGDLLEALELCETAAAQGWRDNWEKRISRLKKKLAARHEAA